ncbi:unannotated protein [freshwater metagenome]|uniref:Unannotated protein n=1 Tax=freshwater metagenome TaxID=449393 RepID=A0A6J7C9Y8_9ZZZZ
MTHALTTYLGTCYFYTASLADDSLKANALVLTAVALPVTSRSEDLLVKEAVFFWLEGSVVDCLWLLYFSKRPLTNMVS